MFIDFVIRGEGERTFLQLMDEIENESNFGTVKWLVYRHGDDVIVNQEQDLIEDISE